MIRKEIIDNLNRQIPLTIDEFSEKELGLIMTKMLVEQNLKGKFMIDSLNKSAKFSIILDKQNLEFI